MIPPKDYPDKEQEKPTQVEDHIAEDRIKWGTIVQTLILASIIGTVSMGASFANHLLDESQEFKTGIIDGIEGINNTLKEIRGDIYELSTSAKVNETKINNHEARITRLEGGNK